LDGPRTCLDPWYLSCTSHIAINDGIAFWDTLEQESVYSAKRALTLVCKAWNELATEYLYEHIICGFSKAIEYSALIALLQDSARSEQLARFVIRVDLHDSLDHHHLQSTFLRLCPNLQRIYLKSYNFYYPYPYSDRWRNLPTASITYELLQTPEYEHFWSAADSWHSLTICFDIPTLDRRSVIPMTQESTLSPPTHSNGKEFTNLRHIVFISAGRNRYSIRCLKHWQLPSLTHLTITSYIPSAERSFDDVLDMLQSSELGSRLKFFALFVHRNTLSSHTTASASLELLKAMPNLEEVALPFFWVSVPPPSMTVTFPKVRTVGMEIDRMHYTSGAAPENAFATYAETCCRLFPNMRRMRTTATTPLHTVVYFISKRIGPMIHLKKAAAVLKSLGIKFEDCAGWDITQLFQKAERELSSVSEAHVRHMPLP
jgi:hypothetical protein